MKKKRSFIGLILIFLCIISCKQKISTNKLNNDYKFLADTIKETYGLKEYNRTKVYLKKYLHKAENSNSLLYLGKGYFKLGVYYADLGQLDSAYYFYNKTIPLFKKIEDSTRLAKTYLNISIIESDFNEYSESNETSVKALKYLSNKNDNYKASINNNIGINLRNQKLLETAINYYIKAIKLSTDDKNILTYRNNLANVYGDLKQYSKAINILESLLLDSKIHKYSKIKAKIIHNLSYKKWLENSNSIVLSGFLEAKKIREIEKDNQGLIASYAHLSDYYKKKSEKQSLGYAYKMLEVAEKEKSPNDIIEAYDKIRTLEKPLKALKIANKRSKLKDSLELAKDKAQNKFALIKFESEENEKKAIENKFLAEKSKKENQLWIFIVIASLLTLIAYIFYKTQKTKKEKIIEVYKTETRLAKKIHDELANDVYLAMNKLQNETNSPTTLLHDLEKIYDQTRNISHENSPVVTGEKFQGFLEQLFIDFSTDTCKVLYKGLSETGIGVVSKEKQIVLYRVLQELLINMKKYSKANLVIVSFSVLKNNLEVAYKDNGIGTDVVIIKNGLQNMETRIKSVGGRITFESEKEKGFKVNFQFKK